MPDCGHVLENTGDEFAMTSSARPHHSSCGSVHLRLQFTSVSLWLWSRCKWRSAAAATGLKPEVMQTVDRELWWRVACGRAPAHY